jgi:hypothetical protein
MVQYLPLEVGQFDYIEIDKGDPANTGCCQVGRRSTTQSTDANDEDMGTF